MAKNSGRAFKGYTMKKVVMFAGPIHENPPTKGAAVESWMYEVSKRIIKYQTHIISILHDKIYPKYEFKDGIYFHRIYFNKIYKRIFQKILGWDVLSYNKRVFNIIKKINPDIVHIHNYYGAREIIKWIKNYNSNIKIIIHLHNEFSKFKNGYEKIDILIGCSKYIVNFYKKMVEANNYKIVYNGVDIKKFDYIKDFAENINKNLKKDNEINICYFGRISPEKGVDKFVKLAYEMKNYDNYNFYCFGEISKRGKRKDFYNDLISFIDKNNLNIKFFDYIPPQKIHLAYQYADIIVIPSKFEEPFGMVALEALASKKIVIASKKGGLVEFLNEENSFLIDDYNNFEKETKNIILNLKNKDFIIENGYKTAKKFDWMNIAISLESIYDEI